MSERQKSYARKWQRERWRRMNGWDESALDTPPEPRLKRDGLYHQIVDMVYSDPSLHSGNLAERLGVSSDTIHNTLQSRRTRITELREEAREAVNV